MVVLMNGIKFIVTFTLEEVERSAQQYTVTTTLDAFMKVNTPAFKYMDIDKMKKKNDNY